MRLQIRANFGYDLDNSHETPLGGRRPGVGTDLYRLTRARGDDALLGQPGKEVIAVPPSFSPEECKDLFLGHGDEFSLAHVAVGQKLCLVTSEHRWALIEITAVPKQPRDPIEALVAVVDD